MRLKDPPAFDRFSSVCCGLPALVKFTLPPSPLTGVEPAGFISPYVSYRCPPARVNVPSLHLFKSNLRLFCKSSWFESIMEVVVLGDLWLSMTQPPVFWFGLTHPMMPLCSFGSGPHCVLCCFLVLCVCSLCDRCIQPLPCILYSIMCEG